MILLVVILSGMTSNEIRTIQLLNGISHLNNCSERCPPRLSIDIKTLVLIVNSSYLTVISVISKIFV